MENKKLAEISENIVSLIPILHKKLLTCKEDCSNISPNNPKLRVLGMLSFCGSLPISTIGNRLYISKPHMSTLIDSLIKDRLVKRIPDKNDRRIINIDITEQGRSHLKELRSNLEEVVRKNLSKLTNKDIEIINKALIDFKETIKKIND